MSFRWQSIRCVFGCLLVSNSIALAQRSPVKIETGEESGDLSAQQIAPFDDEFMEPTGARYTNGSPTYLTGSEFTNWRTANDFRVEETVIINSVDFSAFDTSNSNFSDWDGTIYWEIRNNTNEKPGFVIDSGSGVNITRVYDWTFSGWDFYDWSMDFGKDVQIPAGDYWFVLKMNARCNERANFYWSEATGNGFRPQHSDEDCLNRWVANTITSEHVFTLYGPGGGDQLFDNGRPDYRGGMDHTGASRADNFILNERSTVTGARFSLLDADPDNLAEWDGTGTWEILADANGLPGVRIAGGEITNASALRDQVNDFGEFRDFTFSLDRLVCLEPGTYWLSLHLNALCLRTDLSWATTRVNEGSHAVAADCGTQWLSRTGELAFEVLGSVDCDVIYDNGRPTYFSGREFTGSWSFGVFTLANPASLRSIEFSLLDLDWDNLDEWDRTGSFGIWSTLNGEPDRLVAGGDMIRIKYTFDRLERGFYYYNVEFDLNAETCLEVGTYWLGLHLNQTCDNRLLHWSYAAPDIGSHYVTFECSGDPEELPGLLSFLIRGTNSCDCLTLDVDPLVSGGSAEWRVSGADANSEVAIVYGHQPGSTVVKGFNDYCATFGIKGVSQSRLVCRKTADANGNMSCRKSIPPGLTGLRVLSQAAQRGTCPNDECVSNIDEQVIQ